MNKSWFLTFFLPFQSIIYLAYPPLFYNTCKSEIIVMRLCLYIFHQLYGSLFGQIQLFNLDAAKHQDEESSEKDQKKQEDFLCSGNIIGEIGLLTNSVRTCSVTCETAVQVRYYYITMLALWWRLIANTYW